MLALPQRLAYGRDSVTLPFFFCLSEGVWDLLSGQLSPACPLSASSVPSLVKLGVWLLKESLLLPYPVSRHLLWLADKKKELVPGSKARKLRKEAEIKSEHGDTSVVIKVQRCSHAGASVLCYHRNKTCLGLVTHFSSLPTQPLPLSKHTISRPLFSLVRTFQKVKMGVSVQSYLE